MIYSITTTKGVVIGFTEEINYIRINSRNKCFNPCDKKHAIGIAYKGKPYNLAGHNDIPNTETVVVRPDDYGARLTALKEENAKLRQQLEETDEAAIELYEETLAKEVSEAEQDEAIIQIYEMIGEITNG